MPNTLIAAPQQRLPNKPILAKWLDKWYLDAKNSHPIDLSVKYAILHKELMPKKLAQL